METSPESKIICDVLKAMSNDIRARIANYIKDKKTVTFEEIRKEFNLNSNTLTFHLNKLKNAHIISQNDERGPYSQGTLGVVIYDARSIIAKLRK
jgi:predicted transcriptional regulator